MTRDRSACKPLLLPTLALCCAACGGGGGGGAVPSDALNEGVYDEAAFSYVDPKPVSYHPLTKPVFAAVRRDEVAHLVSAAAASFELDDKIAYDESGVSYPPIPDAATADLRLRNATTGDVDGDGRPELLVIGTFGPEEFESLRVNVLKKVGAQWLLLGSFEPGGAGESYATGRVEAGDFDGDGRDEILVSATYYEGSGLWHSWVRVFEDPIQAGGFGAVAHAFEYPGVRATRAIAAQLDEDGEMELVLHVGNAGGDGGKGYVLDDAVRGYAAMLSVPLYSDATLRTVELVAFQRDDDALQEIAVVEDTNAQKLVIEVFDDSAAGFALLKKYGAVSSGLVSSSGFGPDWMRRAKAGDVDGDGREDLVVLVMTKSGSEYTLATRVHWSNGTVTQETGGFATSVPQGWDLALADRNSDNACELVVSYVTKSNSSGNTHLYTRVKEFDASTASKLKNTFLGGPFTLPEPTEVVLAGDDFDMDGVRMRWKGVKFKKLPDPTLIVVLAAPPTKKGISQAYDASDVSYTSKHGYSTSYEVTRGDSWSIALGFELEDPTGLNGISFKASLKGAVEHSMGTTGTVEQSTTFTGGYDEDVVLFEGTLHMIYIYEWVAAANPACIGTEVSINVPLETKIYKWTRTFFEDTFGARSPIPADLLTHTIGNPSSYPRHNDAMAILEDYEGFEGDSVTVGQGKGSNAVGLSMEDCLTNETKWSVEVELEAEGKVAGITFGKSRGITRDWVWTSSTTKGTEYEGRIGDIHQSGDYFTWGYDVGMFTYRRTDQAVPFQVLQFWTDPWGSGY